MKELAYYDGEIGTPDEVKVPFNDRVHFFGDGVYDATVGGNHKVYLLKDHLDRFYSSAAALDIKIPMEKAALGKLLTELLEQVEGQIADILSANNHLKKTGNVRSALERAQEAAGGRGKEKA